MESGDHDDISFVQFLMHTRRLDPDDAPLRVRAVRFHPCHRARERDSGLSHGAKRHREQRDRDLLARRHEHVHFARVLIRRVSHLLRQRDQIVRRIAHRRDHHDNPIVGGFFAEDALCDVLYLLGRRNRTSAKFLYNKCHIASP